MTRQRCTTLSDGSFTIQRPNNSFQRLSILAMAVTTSLGCVADSLKLQLVRADFQGDLTAPDAPQPVSKTHMTN
ncbi:hypothetical protein RRF57_010354 [Xylaria bambusicola]|uniref:Uncharacterized protein n=1 Tax=Xylaria bambusicola TaxID=326684 RepID=A0AAN7ZCL1_9PEZI